MKPRGKAFCVSRSSGMPYLTPDQSSSYHLSLPRGTRVCGLVQLPWAWFVNCTPFLRGNVGDEFEKTMITVTVWKLGLASDDCDIAPEALPVDCSLTERPVSSHHRHVLETPDVTPGCRQVMCQSSAVTAAPEDLFHVVISFDCICCPAPDLAHSFSSSGKEWEQKNGKVGERAVICELFFFFFFEKPEKCNMVSINSEKKSVGFVWFYPLQSLSFLFRPLCALWEIRIKFKIWVLTW